MVTGEVDILGLTADSRAVRPGYLFAALCGGQADGADYVSDALARGAANIADPSAQSPERQAAIARIRAAIAAEPFMIAGDGRACSDIIPALAGKAYIKFGAEGVFFAPILELGLGLALKVRDGATRAADTAIASLLAYLGLLDSTAQKNLAAYIETPLCNWRGIHVGTVRAVLEP